jgi:hypothetical protein
VRNLITLRSTSLDVRTFAIVAIGFAMVATLASYIPARRATMVDPRLRSAPNSQHLRVTRGEETV